MNYGQHPRTIRVHMLSGKSVGVETILVDTLHVCQWLTLDTVRVTLPGLEGDALVLPENPEHN